jgi:carbonic anhydrase
MSRTTGRIDAVLAQRSRQRPGLSGLQRCPRTGVAVLCCMDARIDVYRILGLSVGDAHVIRNAGGIITDDVVFALAVSQRLLGTREILVMHHLDCAMRKVRGEDLAAAVQRDTGRLPRWRLTTCAHPVLGVRAAVDALVNEPCLPHTEVVRGFLYDEPEDTLTEVPQSAAMMGVGTTPTPTSSMRPV